MDESLISKESTLFTKNQYARKCLLRMFKAAVDSALPAKCVPLHLPPPPKGRTIVVGAGKAAAAMAQSVENHWKGSLEGVVVTRYGHAVPCRQVKVMEAGHPISDEAGIRATNAILQAVSNLTSDDLVICLLSGGGSALMPALPDGISLKDEQDLTEQLLSCGASIAEINSVRTQVSCIKGGRLAAAAFPARIVSLIISDVPGDDPSLVASGPTSVASSTCQQALDILESYGIDIPPSIQRFLRDGQNNSPNASDLAHAEAVIIASAHNALTAAAVVAEQMGYQPFILGDAIEGEARVAGALQATTVKKVISRNHPLSPPCVLLSGGETTVTVSGEGRGGRNTELLLSLQTYLGYAEGVAALAADTDGIDGNGDNAGAIMDDTTHSRACGLQLNADKHLERNDSYGFFNALGDLIVTGPTLTNVNDFRAILIHPPEFKNGTNT